MLKDARRLALKLVLIILIMAALSALGIVSYSSKILVTSNAAYIDKLDRLKSLNSPKAVFIGGSATNYGIHAEEFEKATGIPSINMGLNAGVSFHSYIDSMLPYIGEDDIVFLTPEYSYYSRKYDKLEESDVQMRYYFDTSLLRQMRPVEIVPFIAMSISTGLQDWSNLVNETIRDTVFKEGYGVYYRKNSNEYGDFIGHRGLPSKAFSGLPLEHTVSDFVVRLEDGVQSLEKKGARVFLLFPPYDSMEYSIHGQFIEEIYSAVNAELSATVLFRPQDSVYSHENFFDTVYHLTWEAAENHTSMIVERYLQAK